MNCNAVKQGLKVRTVAKLDTTDGMLIAAHNLDARKPNTEGTVVGYVPGHGGDVWWVQHNDGVMAAYAFNEIQEVAK
jgi:hypothetical protein